MIARLLGVSATVLIGIALAMDATVRTRAESDTPKPAFQTSDRCLACHNGLATPSGEDISIGIDWRASMMANSSRDPYWQASVRREILDHPQATVAIEDECSVCHMPIPRYEAHVRGRHGAVFSHLPLAAGPSGREAADGVSCSVCHQIGKDRLGTADSFNGGFVVQPPHADGFRPEYGPFEVEAGHTRIMTSSTEGYRPTQSDHIRDSAICATCHTLFTNARGARGESIGQLPEQVPYQEWLHSEFKQTKSCQACHMPVVAEPAPITRVFGVPREGVSRHTFVAANFFMQRMLNRYRDDLAIAALPEELTAAADRTIRFLETEAARLRIDQVRVDLGRLQADVVVENLGGHKLPTAYPSRRAWLHVTIRDGGGRSIFESGALRPDGSIDGNDNDADASTFEPHRNEIRAGSEVQIYESILGDGDGRVTTGLLTAVRYVKDNRLLPRGFDKRNAPPDIAVHGAALDDADFAGGSDRTTFSIDVANARGPFAIDVELLYQPIAYRWANNLKAYEAAAEPRRFIRWYDAMAAASATRLAHASRSTSP